MCDPITIAGLALTAGSVAANSIANSNDVAARNSVLTAETNRNKALEQEAAAANQHAQSQYTDFTGQQDARSSELGDYFGSPGPANIASGSIMPASSSDIVNQDSNRQLADEKAYTGGQADALGKLKSFGDLLGDTSRVQARDAGTVAQLGGFEQGNAVNVLPYQLDAASHSGDTARLIGDLLAGSGSVVSGVGALKNPSALLSLFKTAAPKVAGAAAGGLGAGANAIGSLSLG